MTSFTHLLLSSLVALTLTAQAWADVAPGCDTQPQGASPLMLCMMLGVVGIAVLVGRRNQDHNEDS